MNDELFKYLTPFDFDTVGVVANTCNMKKLSQAINEALEFDMKHTFCFEFMFNVTRFWGVHDNTNPAPELDPNTRTILAKAINGGAYVIPNTTRVTDFAGLKKIWTLYAYSKYIIINPFDDTATGLVHKNSPLSDGVSVKDLTFLENKYKNMAKDGVKHTLEFLCRSKEYLPFFDACNCQLSCGCVGSCTCAGKPRKLTGMRLKNVEK